MHELQIHEITCTDGARIVLRRLANEGRPRLLLSHGNGFAIAGYRAFWSLLRSDFELVLFDLRSHGANARHTLEGHTVAAMARDHVSVAQEAERAFGPRPTAGVFHSIASISAILAARDHGLRWDALALIDPPLVAPEGHPMRETSVKLDVFLAQLARSKPQRFDDVESLAQQFRARMGRGWVAGAEFDMAAGVTRPAPEGGYELACPGEYEARIYEDNVHTDSYRALSALRQPTFIIGADPDLEKPMPPARIGPVAAAEHGLPHDIVRGTSHMLQIEKPEEAAAFLRQRLRDAKFA